MTRASDLNRVVAQALESIDTHDREVPLRKRLEIAMRTIVLTCGESLLSGAAPVQDAPHISPQDVVQDVLGKFARLALETDFRKKLAQGHPYGFLFAMVKRRALDLRKASLREQRKRERAALELSNIAPPTLHQEESHEQKRARLEQAMRALPEDAYQVLKWRIVDEFSHEQLADKLGISAAAARKRYSRATKKLQALLETTK